MKIALFSDLHTEFWKGSEIDAVLEPMLHTGAEVVVLAGDIASGRTNVKQILRKFGKAYSKVIYVPGNHEYYGSTVQKFDAIGIEEDNVFILNNGLVNTPEVVFIGATLWTCFGRNPLAEHAARSMISDFRLIGDFVPANAVARYERDVEFIQAMYQAFPDKKKVIVTHFLPAQACVSPRFRNGNILNDYFANSLDSWIADLNNTTWMFGHTHDSIDLMIGDTRMLCNPYGYRPHELNPQFNNNFVINV
jgi:predicted phosphohydrolase